MSKLLTIALMFKVLDGATAPVRRINDTVGQTGRELERASGKSGLMKTAIDRIAASAVSAGNRLDALNKKTEKLADNAQKLDGLGRPLAASGAVGTIGIETTIRKFADLEEAQKELRTTLMDSIGRVGPEFQRLNSLAEKLGTDLPGSTKDMVGMFIALRDQGVQTNRILNGTGEAAAKFGSLMHLPFDVAATYVAKFSEVGGIADRDMNKYMDMLQRLKYASGVTVEELSYTYKYAAGGLKLLGMQGLEHAREFAAIVGMAAKEGIQGETAGSAFSAAASRMAEIANRLNRGQVKKLVGPILERHNIKLEFFTDQGQFKGFRPMIAELEKLKALNPKEQMTTLSKLFRGDAGIMAYLAILMKQGVSGYDEMLGRMKKQADMETKIQEIMSGTKMKWETTSGTVENLIAHVGGLFAGLIRLPGVLDRLNTLFGALDSWTLLHPKTAGAIAGLVLGLTSLAVVSGALLITVAGFGAAWPRALEGLALLSKGAGRATEKMVGLYLSMRRKWVLSRLPDAMFGDVIPGRAAVSVSWLTRLRTAAFAASGGVRAFGLALFTTPLGWFALAIAAAGLLIYKFWGPISGFFKGVWRGILEGAAPAIVLFRKLEPALGPLKGIYTLLKGLLKPFDDTGSRAEAFGVRVGRVFGKMLSFVLQLPAKMLLAGGNIFESLYQGMLRKASKPIEMMKSIAQRVRNFLPFSPAKEGPLKDIHRIKLVETIADSMKPAPMVKAMRAATAATMLAVTPVSSLAHAAGGNGGSMTIHFSPQITVQGGGNPEQIQGAVNQAITLSYGEFKRMMRQYESDLSRGRFDG